MPDVLHISSLLVVRQNLAAHEPADPDMSTFQHSTFLICECRGKSTMLAHGLSVAYAQVDVL